jgi:hypothetical protein
MRFLVSLLLSLIIIFPAFGSSDEFAELKIEKQPLKCSLKFREPPSDTQDSLEEEDMSCAIMLTSADNEEYPAPDPELYPNACRVWPALKGLHPYIRAEGFPFMEALIRLTTGIAFQSSLSLVRLLFQVSYDMSEIFQTYNIDYSLCGKSLLYFCRHEGFSKWQRRIHFAVNSCDTQIITQMTAELKRLGYSSHPTAFGYRIYIDDSFKLQAPWENVAFSPKIKEPIAIIRLYDEGNEGLNYIDFNTPLKDDYISKESWLTKASCAVTGGHGKIRLNIIGNAKNYLNHRYSSSWQTHEARDDKLLCLSKEELKPAIPEIGWSLRVYTKPRTNFFSSFFN